MKEPAVVSLDGYQNVQSLPMDGVKDYNKPWKIQASIMVAKLITEAPAAMSALKNAVANWNKVFAKQAVYKESDVVSSPLTQKLGALELNPLFEMMVATDQRVQAVKVPAFEAMLDTPKILGESEFYSNCDFEQGFLASVRLQLSGKTRIMMIDPTNMIKVMRSKNSSAELQLSQLRGQLMSLTQSDLATLKAWNAELYFAALAPSDLLYVPPGWLVAQSTVDGEPASHIKRSFLPVSSLKASKSILESLNESTTMRQGVKDMLGMLLALMGAKVASAAAA